MRITGGQIYLFTSTDGGLRAVGSATDCAVQIDAERVELCPKGSTSRRYRAGRTSWSVTVDRFFAFSDDGGILPATCPLGQPITATVFVLKRALVEAGVDPDTLPPEEPATIIGDAIVVEISPRGTKGTAATCGIRLQGSGVLQAMRRATDGFIYTLPIIFRE